MAGPFRDPIGLSPASLALYLDEDMPMDAAHALAARGYRASYARWVLPSSTLDDDRLRYAAVHGFTLVARNRRDYELLHHAWRSWSQFWRVQPIPTHAGILITPGSWDAARIAEEVDRFLRTGAELTNALYVWTPLRARHRAPDPR